MGYGEIPKDKAKNNKRKLTGERKREREIYTVLSWSERERSHYYYISAFLKEVIQIKNL